MLVSYTSRPGLGLGYSDGDSCSKLDAPGSVALVLYPQCAVYHPSTDRKNKTYKT